MSEPATISFDEAMSLLLCHSKGLVKLEDDEIQKLKEFTDHEMKQMILRKNPIFEMLEKVEL